MTSSRRPTIPASPIPALTAEGHLPLGRYPATLDEVYARFVTHPDFSSSATRGECWRGLTTYLALWRKLSEMTTPARNSDPLLLCLWLAGGFISAKTDPNNIDLTLIIDGDVIDRAAEMRLGISGPLTELTNRDRALKDFRLSPTVIRYRYFDSPFTRSDDPRQRQYLESRGGYDDWWSRIRQPTQEKQAPTRDSRHWRRGYLEVTL